MIFSFFFLVVRLKIHLKICMWNCTIVGVNFSCAPDNVTLRFRMIRVYLLYNSRKNPTVTRTMHCYTICLRCTIRSCYSDCRGSPSIFISFTHRLQVNITIDTMLSGQGFFKCDSYRTSLPLLVLRLLVYKCYENMDSHVWFVICDVNGCSDENNLLIHLQNLNTNWRKI